MDIAYDGTDFHGWARQPGVRTVQDEISTALRIILDADEAVEVVCAGRTDAGVHARGQVAHADLMTDLDSGTILRRLTGVLPRDVAVTGAVEVSSDFDARFSAVSRSYAYRIADGYHARDPLRRADVLTHARRLDIEAMNAAAEHLVGEHDFAAFCRKSTYGTTIRRVLQCHWNRDERDRAVLSITADAFCHSMVRSITGALVAVGEGRRTPDWVEQTRRDRLRIPAVRKMPAHGLTLEAVGYPPESEWVLRQQVTRAVRESVDQPVREAEIP